VRDDDALPFCRIGPSGYDKLGSALLMYTTKPLRPPTVKDLLVDAARLSKTPGATRIDLSLDARVAILRSPYIHRKADDPVPGRYVSSSPPTIFGIPLIVDPNLPGSTVVFRDRQGNALHTVVLAE
jgi:hypothetical protein